MTKTVFLQEKTKRVISDRLHGRFCHQLRLSST